MCVCMLLAERWGASVQQTGARGLVCCAGRRESEPWELSASRPPTARRASRMVWRLRRRPVGAPAGREFIEKHVKPMSEDLEKKRALFMDDASFISEARPRTPVCVNAVSEVSMSAQCAFGAQHLAGCFSCCCYSTQQARGKQRTMSTQTSHSVVGCRCGGTRPCARHGP